MKHDGPHDPILPLAAHWIQEVLGVEVPKRLEFSRVVIDSDASVLECLSKSDHVHPMNGDIEALLPRLDSEYGNRRVFMLTHPLISTPLAFVQVFLTNDLLCTMQDVFNPQPPLPDEKNTAVFYSINSTPMTDGLYLGKRLLDSAVAALSEEQITHFGTLSPIPHLRPYIRRNLSQLLRDNERQQLATLYEKLGVDSPEGVFDWMDRLDSVEALREDQQVWSIVDPILDRLTVYYLYRAKRPHSHNVQCPVQK